MCIQINKQINICHILYILYILFDIYNYPRLNQNIIIFPYFSQRHMDAPLAAVAFRGPWGDGQHHQSPRRAPQKHGHGHFFPWKKWDKPGEGCKKPAIFQGKMDENGI